MLVALAARLGMLRARREASRDASREAEAALRQLRRRPESAGVTGLLRDRTRRGWLRLRSAAEGEAPSEHPGPRDVRSPGTH